MSDLSWDEEVMWVIDMLDCFKAGALYEMVECLRALVGR